MAAIYIFVLHISSTSKDTVIIYTIARAKGIETWNYSKDTVTVTAIVLASVAVLIFFKDQTR